MGDKTGSVLFVSGVDTDCGKTFVTARLAEHLQGRGCRVVTQKPVQTGCDGPLADDIAEHRRQMGCATLPEDSEGLTCSYLFRKPASPALAARLEGVEIDPARIDGHMRMLAQAYDAVLVEGAGGLMVPLTDSLLTIEYVASRRLPLALVATSRLGGINHALLSISACRAYGVDLRAVVFNRMPAGDEVMADDNLAAIRRYAASLFPAAVVTDFRETSDLKPVGDIALASRGANQ